MSVNSGDALTTTTTQAANDSLSYVGSDVDDDEALWGLSATTLVGLAMAVFWILFLLVSNAVCIVYGYRRYKRVVRRNRGNSTDSRASDDDTDTATLHSTNYGQTPSVIVRNQLVDATLVGYVEKRVQGSDIMTADPDSDEYSIPRIYFKSSQMSASSRSKLAAAAAAHETSVDKQSKAGHPIKPRPRVPPKTKVAKPVLPKRTTARPVPPPPPPARKLTTTARPAPLHKPTAAKPVLP